MTNKRYNSTIQGVLACIEAEREGECRYMVTMSLPVREVRPFRIGYLTGRQRTWVGEPFDGTKQSVPGKSAKAVCLEMATRAMTMPELVPLIAEQLAGTATGKTKVTL